MGRKRIIGLDWLEPENTHQRLWALEYLRAKGFADLFHHSKHVLPNQLPSHNEMLDAGMYVEQEPAARELFGDMKDAWRQEKERQKNKESGRQVCAFTLESRVKTQLQIMAKEQNKSATALLESLITKAHSAHLRRQQKQHSKHSPRAARNYSFQGSNNIGENHERQKSAHPPETASHLDPTQKVEHEANSTAGEFDAHTLKPLPAAEIPQTQKWTRAPNLTPPQDSQAAEIKIADEHLTEQPATADHLPEREINDIFTPTQDVIELPLKNLKLQKKKPFVLPVEEARVLKPSTD